VGAVARGENRSGSAIRGWHAACWIYTQEVCMASDSSNSSIVAIFAIIMLLAVGGFVAWRMGAFNFGGGDTTHKIDVDVK
jgi:hypothetical protein